MGFSARSELALPPLHFDPILHHAAGVTDHMHILIEDIRQRYPYWNRTNGKDHFFVSRHPARAHRPGCQCAKHQPFPALAQDLLSGLFWPAVDYRGPRRLPHWFGRTECHQGEQPAGPQLAWTHVPVTELPFAARCCSRGSY